MKIGYARVSTKGQQKDGNGLEVQIKQLMKAGAENIVEEAFTGTKTDRPKFSELISKLQPGDTLMVCKLDRFARTASEGSALIKKLLDNNIKVHILNMGLIENTPTGKLIMNVLLSFAEFERDMIVERTQAGKAIAREKPGYQEGRPRKYNDEQLELAVNLLKQGNSYGKVAKMTGMSKGCIYRAAIKQGLVNKEA